MVLSTQAQNKNAANYNNKIIDIQYKLVPDVVKFFRAMEGGSLTDLKTMKEVLSKDFEKALKKINQMKAFEGDIKLRDAALDWFNLYKSSLDSEYNHILELAAKPKDKRTSDETAKLKKLAEDLISKETVVDEKFQAAQLEFSKKHNLELKEYPIGHK